MAARYRHLDAQIARIYSQTMQVSLKYAEEHLADLMSAAYRGEEIEIAEPDQPSIRLALVVPEASAKRSQRLLGSGKGEIWLADDWDSEETNNEIADLFENSVIFPEIAPGHSEA